MPNKQLFYFDKQLDDSEHALENYRAERDSYIRFIIFSNRLELWRMTINYYSQSSTGFSNSPDLVALLISLLTMYLFKCTISSLLDEAQ